MSLGFKSLGRMKPYSCCSYLRTSLSLWIMCDIMFFNDGSRIICLSSNEVTWFLNRACFVFVFGAVFIAFIDNNLLAANFHFKRACGEAIFSSYSFFYSFKIVLFRKDCYYKVKEDRNVGSICTHTYSISF